MAPELPYQRRPLNAALGAAHPSHIRLLLALRALFFVLLLPGTLAGYIPFSILRAGNLLRVPDLGLASVCAAVFAITGALVLLRCVWDFFAAGKGTLAPIDPPRFLVVRGLYRFTRNPMYNGVIALILGEAWLFRSIGLAEYALLILILFHLFVLLYEEPALESQFGESYRAYRRAVPRWASRLGRFKRAPGAPPNTPLQLTVTSPAMREYAQQGLRQQLNAGR